MQGRSQNKGAAAAGTSFTVTLSYSRRAALVRTMPNPSPHLSVILTFTHFLPLTSSKSTWENMTTRWKHSKIIRPTLKHVIVLLSGSEFLLQGRLSPNKAQSIPHLSCLLSCTRNHHSLQNQHTGHYDDKMQLPYIAILVLRHSHMANLVQTMLNPSTTCLASFHTLATIIWNFCRLILR